MRSAKQKPWISISVTEKKKTEKKRGSKEISGGGVRDRRPKSDVLKTKKGEMLPPSMMGEDAQILRGKTQQTFNTSAKKRDQLCGTRQSLPKRTRRFCRKAR